MTTNAPQIPVKTITALWFSMFAPGFLPSSKREVKQTCGRARRRTGRSQTALFLSHDNPHRGDYDDGSMYSAPILMRELSNQQEFIGHKKTKRKKENPIAGKTRESQVSG